MLTFKEKVYAVAKEIPKGKVLTYKEVARNVAGYSFILDSVTATSSMSQTPLTQASSAF